MKPAPATGGVVILPVEGVEPMSLSGSPFDGPPELPTLRLMPSWLNNAGRIDRSACFELRASEVRRFAKMNRARTFARPGNRHPEARVWREAAGTVTISPRFLARINRDRLPLQLWGDRRTTRANVMKPINHPKRDESRHERLHDVDSAPNPNKGASRTKMFGVYCDGAMTNLGRGWRQTLRIERWRLHERLARHFLLCPVDRGGCNEKMSKLFLVQAHLEEILDAEEALMWIKAIDQRAEYLRATRHEHRLRQADLPRTAAARDSGRSET